MIAAAGRLRVVQTSHKMAQPSLLGGEIFGFKLPVNDVEENCGATFVPRCFAQSDNLWEILEVMVASRSKREALTARSVFLFPRRERVHLGPTQLPRPRRVHEP